MERNYRYMMAFCLTLGFATAAIGYVINATTPFRVSYFVIYFMGITAEILRQLYGMNKKKTH